MSTATANASLSKQNFSKLSAEWIRTSGTSHQVSKTKSHCHLGRSERTIIESQVQTITQQLYSYRIAGGRRLSSCQGFQRNLLALCKVFWSYRNNAYYQQHLTQRYSTITYPGITLSSVLSSVLRWRRRSEKPPCYFDHVSLHLRNYGDRNYSVIAHRTFLKRSVLLHGNYSVISVRFVHFFLAHTVQSFNRQENTN